VGQNVEGKSLDMFLCLMNFVNQSCVETNDTGIDSSFKDGLVNPQSKTNSGALVRQRTIPTERPPLVGEVSANFSG
jgi:hypothetical protein